MALTGLTARLDSKGQPKGYGKSAGAGKGAGWWSSSRWGKGAGKGNYGGCYGGWSKKLPKPKGNGRGKYDSSRPNAIPPPNWSEAWDWKSQCGEFNYSRKLFCRHCSAPRPTKRE